MRRRAFRLVLHPFGRGEQAPTLAGIVAVAAALALSWLLCVALDGTEHIAPHWFYLPIFWAGLRFGRRGAALTAAAAAVVAGPLLPADVDTWSPQPASDWISRGMFFLGIGLIVAELFRSLDRAADSRAAEAELRARLAAETRFRVLVETSHDVLTVLDENGNLLARHGPVEAVLGSTAAATAGRLDSLLPPADRVLFADAFSRVRATGASETITLRMEDGSGWRHLESLIRDLRDEPAVAGIVVTSRDITERHALHAELEHRATHDPLTGLANRALFAARLEAALHRAAGRTSRGETTTAALLLIDLDEFKAVNDRFGHATGDDLLERLAHRLAATVRGSDTAARLGGDEFAVLIPDVESPSAAVAVAAKLSDELTRPVPLRGRQLAVGVSIGVATTAEHGYDSSVLLHEADVAMYRAKPRRSLQRVYDL